MFSKQISRSSPKFIENIKYPAFRHFVPIQRTRTIYYFEYYEGWI